MQKAGVVQNTKQIESVNKTANYRVPDHLIENELGIVESGEVKNFKVTKKLSLNKQIRDLVDYGEINKIPVRIWLNEGVSLTKPLIDYINNKNVHIHWY